MITYLETESPAIVIKQEQSSIDLGVLLNQFNALVVEYKNLPDYKKTVPDAETLAFWNSEMDIQYKDARFLIKLGASELLDKLKPIYEAGLIPVAYHEQYNLLVTFVNS